MGLESTVHTSSQLSSPLLDTSSAQLCELCSFSTCSFSFLPVQRFHIPVNRAASYWLVLERCTGRKEEPEGDESTASTSSWLSLPLLAASRTWLTEVVMLT